MKAVEMRTVVVIAMKNQILTVIVMKVTWTLTEQ